MQVLDTHNDLLRAELGVNPDGDQIYRWTRAGELTYLSWDGSYDYTALDTGLLVPTKHLEQRKILPHLDDGQWVLVFWEPQPRDFWFQFGKSLYGNTNVYLDPGVAPWTSYKGISFTQYVVGLIKEQRRKTRADWDNELLDKDTKRQKNQIEHHKDVIGECFTAFAGLPGKRGGHVSWGGLRDEFPADSGAAVSSPIQESNSDGVNPSGDSAGGISAGSS